VRRINTAGQIPKEVISINRDMVRDRTFNPVDLEHILARPVRPVLVLYHLTSANSRVTSRGPASRERHSAGGLEGGASAVRPMFRFAPAYCELLVCPDRTLL